MRLRDGTLTAYRLPTLQPLAAALSLPEILAHPLANCEEPVFIYHPDRLRQAVRFFLDHFPGIVAYSVKANCTPRILQDIQAAGIHLFDTSSMPEIELAAAAMKDAELSFSNACRKSPHILPAYEIGIRHFAIDSPAELEKLIACLPRGPEIIVPVRIRAPFYENLFNQPHKFGVPFDGARALLQAVHKAGFTPALAFHVGAFSLNPKSYAMTLDLCHDLIRDAHAQSIPIRYINMGGGYPVDGVVQDAPPLKAFLDVIAGYRPVISPDVEFICEPGRAIAAPSQSLLTTVLGVKHDEKAIYINDGGEHGNLREYHDAVRPLTIPFSLIKKGETQPLTIDPSLPHYKIYGFACDTDLVPFSIPVPASLEAGDRLLFPQMGAYTSVQSTRFNGNGLFHTMFVEKN